MKEWKRKWKGLLGWMLALVMTFSEIPVYAAGPEAEQPAEVTEQEEAPEKSDDLGSKSIGDFTEKDEFLKELSYGEPDVLGNADAVTGEYTVFYMLEEGVSVSRYAKERIKAAQNERIILDEQGSVSQSFVSDSEDQLAPVVYLKEGYKISGEQAWYLSYTEKYTVRVGSGAEAHDETRTRTKKAYFPTTAKVKDLQNYAENGKITLYPNWQKSNPVKFELQGRDEYKELIDISGNGIINPNEELEVSGYLPPEELQIVALYGLLDGFTFMGWEYQFGNGEILPAQKVETVTDDQGNVIQLDPEEVYWNINTADQTELLTIYAIWQPDQFNITYKGIEVKLGDKAEAALAAACADGAAMDEALIDSILEDGEYEILGEGEAPLKYLPLTYDAVTTTILPTAAEINDGSIDPEFTKYNRFLNFSQSRKFNRRVEKLGKDGDIYSGDVTLYVIYTSMHPTPELENGQKPAKEKEFSAQQVNMPNLLCVDDYAVVLIKGTKISADMKPESVSLNEAAAKYFELCEVDSLKAELGHGYAAVGIRLKDGITAEEAKSVQKSKANRKIELSFLTEDHDADENGAPVVCSVSFTLKTQLKYPKYKLDKKSAVLYTTAHKENEPMAFYTHEKNGQLAPDNYAGYWTADYVLKDGKEYKPVDAAKVAAVIDETGEIMVLANEAANGFIRLRNSSWIDNAYVYLKFTVKENNKAPKAAFSQKMITLNNTVDGERVGVYLTYAGGCEVAPEGISLDSSKLPAGVSANLAENLVVVKADKSAKKGSYKLFATVEGCSKPAVLTIKVTNTAAEKAVKGKVSGKMDAQLGGSVYVTPKVTGYAGTVSGAAAVAGAASGYDVYWNGASIELASNEAFVPFTKKAEVKLTVFMSTGQALPLTVKLKASKGKLSLDVYDAELKTASDNTAVSVNIPVIATYSYDYWLTAKTRVKKVYTLDLSRPENQALVDIDASALKDKDGAWEASYADGVITVVSKKAAAKEKTYSLSLGGTLKLTGKKAVAKFKLNLK
ncbi:MAG: hypothetical protein IK115_02030 [Lachnospiraceae bacterium]|nr:hypothetical protein [Lachnospiraceae bacterium]